MPDLDRLEGIIVKRLEQNALKPALWWKGAWMKGAEFLELVERTEKTLRDSGFGPGSRIVVLLPNSPLLWAIAVAAWKLGGAIAPLNARSVASLKIVEHVDPVEILGDEWRTWPKPWKSRHPCGIAPSVVAPD